MMDKLKENTFLRHFAFAELGINDEAKAKRLTKMVSRRLYIYLCIFMNI